MEDSRKKYTDAENRLLFNQVNGICPLCTHPLSYIKNNKIGKSYQIAHIYPLNPTLEEQDLLKDEPQLSEDVNSLDNVIPLCLNCHEKFDNPRTVDEYRLLYNIKKKLIEEEKLRNTFHTYTIEEEIISIIDSLNKELGEEVEHLEYKVLKIDIKLRDSGNYLLKKDIKNDVTEYYLFIKNLFAEKDKTFDIFDMVAGQIKGYYKKTAKITNNPDIIFQNMVDWLHSKVKTESREACRIVISFFVQNCEVFSDVT